MPSQGLSVDVREEDVRDLLKKLNKLGVDFMGTLKNVVDDVSLMVQQHAQENHFQVGTGKGSTALAKAHELDFKNPDGSLRFKIRTGNLLNSIQGQESKIEKKGIRAVIKVG